MYIILGQIFALLTAVCWAQNSLIYSHLGKRTGSDAVTHIRLWMALPVMALVNVLFTGQLIPSGLSTGSVVLISFSGFFGFFVADLFLFRAFVQIGPREALVVMTASPVFSLLLSGIFFDERLSWIKIIGVAVILKGIVMVILGEGDKKDLKINHTDNSHRIRGILYALLGALTQAVGLIFAKKAMTDGVHPVSTNLIRITAGLTGLFIYSLVRRKVRSDFASFKDLRSLLLLLFAVLVGPVLGILLSLYALNWAPVGVVTTLMQASPLILLPVDVFLFKRKVRPLAWVGTVLAVSGAALLFAF